MLIFSRSVNTAGLRAATRYVPLDIESIADAHVALAVTKAFRDNFLFGTGAAPGAVIVEGTGVRPAIGISARESGVPHSGFEVSSKHTFHKYGPPPFFSPFFSLPPPPFPLFLFAPSPPYILLNRKEATKAKLAFNKENQAYTGEPFPSTGNFGPFESVYTLSTVIPGVGPISFDITGM